MGRCDQRIKFCSKIQSARNCFKPDKSIGLVVANPTQLVSSQTDVGSERYCNLFIKSNRQKKKKYANCTVRTGRRGRVVRPYNDMKEVMWHMMIGRHGQIRLRHVEFRWFMVRCHVAQSWAATWHPFIWLVVCYVKFYGSVGVEPRTSPPV
jgi:hypothetical protein